MIMYASTYICIYIYMYMYSGGGGGGVGIYWNILCPRAIWQGFWGTGSKAKSRILDPLAGF